MRYNPDNSNNQKPGSKYLKKPEDKKKSKYLRDENDKKSKYLKNQYDSQEHHYNLARHYDEYGNKKTDNNGYNANIDYNADIEETVNNAGENASELFEVADNSANENAVASVEENVTESTYSDEADAAEVQKATADNTGSAPSDEIIDAEPEMEQAVKEEKPKSKGDASSLFQHSKTSRDTTVASVDDSEEKRKSSLALTTAFWMVLLTVVAVILQHYKLKYALFPSILSVDLSVFPELIAALAYGPVFGIIMIVIKNLIQVLIQYNGMATILSNVVLDSIFVVIAGLFYTKRMFAVKPQKTRKSESRDLRRRRIITGGFIATAVTTIASFFLTRFVSYPILIREFSGRGMTAEYILNAYQVALDNLNTLLPEKMSAVVTRFTGLSQAILFYNIPIQFIKYLFISIVVALIYNYISPYLHYRNKLKK